MVAVTSLKREVILDAVEAMYTFVARQPQQQFHFPHGREACRQVGYPDSLLDGIPEAVLESFAGVGYPFAADLIRPGDVVLDLGSGSGTDAFIASRMAGPAGRVYALDMTAAMREKLSANLQRAGVSNVEVLAGNLEAIPLPDQSMDVITSNGVLNLVPDKERAIREIARVLKPGGRLQISDIALARAVGGRARKDPKAWAECIVGAVEERRYFDMLRNAGLDEPEHLGEMDYFALSCSEDTRAMARYFGARSVTFSARKPAAGDRVRAPSRRSTLAGVAAAGAGMFGSVAAAVAASAACFGAPALIALVSALGATALPSHATLYPIFVGFIALSTWQLYRSVRRRGAWAPFLLGAAGALSAAVFLWLMVTGIIPLPGAALYSAVGVLAAGTLWEIGARYREECLVKVRRELARPAPARPLTAVNGAALSVAAAAAFYGMYKSVDEFQPAAATAEIACYGINACKGQTACRTAFNACPGMNACKGKGFVYSTPADCASQGGTPLEDSVAAPKV